MNPKLRQSTWIYGWAFSNDLKIFWPKNSKSRTSCPFIHAPSTKLGAKKKNTVKPNGPTSPFFWFDFPKTKIFYFNSA